MVAVGGDTNRSYEKYFLFEASLKVRDGVPWS